MTDQEEIKTHVIESRQDQIENEVSHVAEKVEKTKDRVMEHEILIRDIDKRLLTSEHNIDTLKTDMSEIKSDTRFIRRTIITAILGSVGTVLATIVIAALNFN